VWAGIACVALVSTASTAPPPGVAVVRGPEGRCALAAVGGIASDAACPCAEWPGRLRLLFGGRVPLTGSVEDLRAVPGIGPARAAAILEERERGGRFADVDALVRVRGIGAATVERMRDWLDSRGACAPQGS
jgi:competence ComEA-like helix-hairpin-helix protein